MLQMKQEVTCVVAVAAVGTTSGISSNSTRNLWLLYPGDSATFVSEAVVVLLLHSRSLFRIGHPGTVLDEIHVP